MIPLSFSDIKVHRLITHHVGNKHREESVFLSETITEIEDETMDFLLKYFLHPFNSELYYRFMHTVDVEMNDVFSLTKKLFDSPNEFVEISQHLARLLYDYSTHPRIEMGELNVVYFSNIVLDDEIVEAIGIFKSETQVPFLKMNTKDKAYHIDHEFGFELKGIDKAALIFNTENEDGFRVLIKDHKNKTEDAQYWKDDFLKLEHVSNAFYQTTQFLNVAKDYLTHKISEDFAVEKADQIDLMNKSVGYFKNNESFNKNQFEQEVLGDDELIESFRNFEEDYKTSNNVAFKEDFEISGQAVKKQAKVFKSVLKLDKNFHIYIHGDRNLIERGQEEDGRKFYKVYYENEE